MQCTAQQPASPGDGIDAGEGGHGDADACLEASETDLCHAAETGVLAGDGAAIGLAGTEAATQEPAQCLAIGRKILGNQCRRRISKAATALIEAIEVICVLTAGFAQSEIK